MKLILHYIENFLKGMVILTIGAMLSVVFLQVITRYIFSYTPSYAEELSRYLFVWVVFLSLPLVAKTGGHMAIETLTSRIHGMPLKVCRVLASIFTMVFLGIMVWYSVLMVKLQHFQTSPALVVPMSYVYSVIPFGCSIMLIYVINDFIKTIRTAPEDIK